MITLCPRKPVQTVISRTSWYSHQPLSDGRIKSLDDIVVARDIALSMYAQGYNTVIHCMAGRNRSGLIGALVIRELDNLTGAEALAQIRELRPRSVDNIHFEGFLLALEKPRAHG
jgi:protein-tyrosine phosphatase